MHIVALNNFCIIYGWVRKREEERRRRERERDRRWHDQMHPDQQTLSSSATWGCINCSRETRSRSFAATHKRNALVRPRKLTLSAVSRSRVCNSCYAKLCILTNGLRPSRRNGTKRLFSSRSEYFCVFVPSVATSSLPGWSKKRRYVKEILINVQRSFYDIFLDLWDPARISRP